MWPKGLGYDMLNDQMEKLNSSKNKEITSFIMSKVYTKIIKEQGMQLIALPTTPNMATWPTNKQQQQNKKA